MWRAFAYVNLANSNFDDLWFIKVADRCVALQIHSTGRQGPNARAGCVDTFFPRLELPVVDGVLVGVVHLFLTQATE